MFDDLITKIFETHRRVLDETNEYVVFEISRTCICLPVFDGDNIKKCHTAFFYDDMPERTVKELTDILKVLEDMLKGGAVVA